LRCAADSHGAVLAYGEAACVDGTCLWRAVELELAVCDDGAGAPIGIAEDAVVEVADEGAVCCLLGWMLVSVFGGMGWDKTGVFSPPWLTRACAGGRPSAFLL
jgi:hypothetical protein